MTKGYCKCGKVIDEVEFSQLGKCANCYVRMEKRLRDLVIIVSVISNIFFLIFLGVMS